MKVELWNWNHDNTWHLECNATSVLLSEAKIEALTLHADEDANPKITVHLDKIPARVDQCEKDIWVVGDEGLKYHPDPIVSYGAKESHTIFTRENVNAPV